MPAKKVGLEDLEAAIVKELQNYSQEVTEKVKAEVTRVSEEAVKELKRTSPRSKNKKDHYADGWRSRVEFESREDIRVRVYNAKKPQLTHLLEDGHAKTGGGRVEGIPHIATAVENAEKKLEADIKVVV